MLIVVFFGLFARLGGLLVQGLLIGRLYGPCEITDAFNAAYQCVILVLSGIALKSLMPALMPLFIEETEKNGEASAWRFANGVITFVIVAALLVTGACIVFAPQIMRLLVPGFFAPGREAGPLSVTMVRIMAPGLLALCLAVAAFALLNSYKIFSIPALAAAVQNFVWAAVLFAIIILFSRGAMAIAIGFLVGALAQITVNVFGLRSKLGFYRPSLGGVGWPRLAGEALILAAFALAAAALWWLSLRMGFRTEWRVGILATAASLFMLQAWWRTRNAQTLMGRFVGLLVPLLFGIAIAKSRDLTTILFTSFTQTGILSDKRFAENVGNLPTVICAYALATAIFPYLCEMASRKDLSSFGGLITRALRMIALFFVPFSLILAVLARPTVQLAFDNGSWPAEHVAYCGLALAVYSLGMFFYAIENVLMQSFFSIQRMWMPTIVGMVASLAQIVFLYVGIHLLGYNEPYQIFIMVIVAFPISRALKNLILLVVFRWYVPILPAKETLRYVVRLAAITAVVAGVTWAVYLPVRKVLNVDGLKVSGELVVDTFNPGEKNAIGEEIETRFLAETGFLVPSGWREIRPSGAKLENLATGDAAPEYALKLSSPGFAVERDLSRFTLGRSDCLSFKVKAERETVLRVTLSGTGAPQSFDVKVKRSDKREKYDVRLKNAGQEKITAVAFEEAKPTGAQGALWLDTVAFQTVFPLSRRLKFEAYKLIQVAVPGVLGLLALVGAAVLFRVEEMGIIYAWIRDEGLAKIKAKLKGGKARAGAPGGPKGPSMPDVET